MKNKLYFITDEQLKKCYKTHYFLCLDQKELFSRRSFGMKQFVNITSGTIVESAIWKVGYDIKEVEPTDEQIMLIERMLKRKKVVDFLSRLSKY